MRLAGWKIVSLFCLFLVARLPADEPAWWHDYYTVLSHPNEKQGRLWEMGVMAERSSWATGWYGPWWIQHQLERRSKHDVLKWVENYRRQGVKNVFYYDAGEFGEFVGLVEQRNLTFNQWDLRFHKGEPGKLLWFGKNGFYSDESPLDLKNYRDFGLPRWTLPDGRPVQSVYELARVSFDVKRDAWDHSRMTVPADVAERLGLNRFLASGNDPNPSEAAHSLGRICSYDHSNPYLLRDFEVGVEMMLRRRPAFLHFDNYFDNETLYPQRQAFGPWSLENFRRYLAEQLSPADRRHLGIEAPGTFDLKQYIQEKPFRSKGHRWHFSNKLWQDDPIWNAFICSKRDDAEHLFRRLYAFCKKTSLANDSEVVVIGNTNPLFPGRSLITGAIDIAHFEHHAARQFGPIVVPTGLPPRGRLGGVTRLGAAISRAGYCWPSVYVPEELSGERHENLHRVLAMDGLANRGVLDYNHQYRDGYSPGSDQSAAWVDCFVRSFSHYYGKRRPMADVAVVFPGQTVLASVSVFTMDPDKCLYDYLGWAQALTELHVQWDVIPDDRLPFEKLDPFRVLILPSTLCLSDTQLEALAGYMRDGGQVIISGEAGTRYGPDRFLWSRPDESRLVARMEDHADADKVDRLDAAGTNEPAHAARWTRTDSLGRKFYTDDAAGGRRAGRGEMASLLSSVLPRKTRRVTTNAPGTVGVFAYFESDSMMAVDVVNYQLVLDTDSLTPAHGVRLVIQPPTGHSWASDDVRLIDPDHRTAAEPEKPRPPTPWNYPAAVIRGRLQPDGSLAVDLPDFRVYCRLSLQFQRTAHR